VTADWGGGMEGGMAAGFRGESEPRIFAGLRGLAGWRAEAGEASEL
jgi:hypothetical protein